MAAEIPAIRIVPMEKRHLQALAGLEKICFSQPWSREAFAEELENPLAYFIVAEAQDDARGDCITGYGGMQHVVDEGYIANIAVHPGCRRRGVATLLLSEFDCYARSHALRLLTLEVRRSNTAAISAYGKAGFIQVGVRPHFYSLPDEDALIMTKYYD